MGLEYYGFGRYGRGNKVTHHAVHDRLVTVADVAKITENVMTVDEEFGKLLEAGAKPKPVGVSQKQTLAKQAKSVSIDKAKAMDGARDQTERIKSSFDSRMKAIRDAAANVHEQTTTQKETT